MAKVIGDIVIDSEKCKGCEVCIDACPQEVLSITEKVNGKGYHYSVAVTDACTGCANCAIVCPDAVITVYRIKKSA